MAARMRFASVCAAVLHQYCQALSRFSSWILISTCHGFCGNIRRRMVGPNFGLVSVDDTVPKLSGTIGVSRHGPAVPMVCDHVGSSSGWTWTRIQRLFTIYIGKPVDSQFGYNLWWGKFRTGKCRPGRRVCTNHEVTEKTAAKAWTQRWLWRNGTRISAWNIPSGKPDYLFRCSVAAGNLPLERPND